MSQLLIAKQGVVENIEGQQRRQTNEVSGYVEWVLGSLGSKPCAMAEPKKNWVEYSVGN